MSRRKRSVDDEDQLVDENNNNKKFKPIQQVFFKSHFETLANEIIFHIFEYLDVYDIYRAFFHYNIRYQNLILHSNSFIQIHVPNISKSEFSTYSSDMIYSNKNRINYLHLSNPFTFNELFYPPRLINEFSQLEILILKNTNIKFLSLSFQSLAKLKHFHTLHISFANTIEYVHDIYRFIFQLPYLKTLNLTYQARNYQRPLVFHSSLFGKSRIEHLTINTQFNFNSLNDLFTCLPNLHYLSMNSIVGNYLSVFDPSIIVLKYLKHVSIKIDQLSFLDLFRLTEAYFSSVEIFNITIRNSSIMSPSNYWTNLIENCMPNLKQFDLNIRNDIEQNSDAMNQLVHTYDEQFWTMRKSFFSHQYCYRDKYDHRLMLYSTNPYRRKDFTLYWETCQMNTHYYLQHKSVEYLKIYGKQANDVPYYFPNVIQLKLANYFQTTNINRSFIDALNRLFPLKQLEILEISDWTMPFDELINLIHSLPKLHTLKLGTLILYQLNLSLVEQHPVVQSIIRTNQIKKFELVDTCSVDSLKFILKLFPNIEHLTIGMNKRQINNILRELFSNNNHKLKFLCFTQTPQRCLKEVDFYLQSRNLLKDYSIKLCNRQLFLWW